jgi:hypothetical protein
MKKKLFDSLVVTVSMVISKSSFWLADTFSVLFVDSVVCLIIPGVESVIFSVIITGVNSVIFPVVFPGVDSLMRI